MRHKVSSPAGRPALSAPYTASPAPRAPSLALFVTASPEEASAGATVSFTVRLSNEGETEVHGVVVSGTLPAGLECLDCRGFYSPGNRRLHWTFGRLSSGQVLTLTFSARVGMEAGWEGGVPLLLSARGVETPQEAKGTAVVRVPYPLPDGPAEVILRPGKGGEVLSPDGRVRVVFPPEAVPVTLTVSYDPEEVEALSMEEADLQLYYATYHYSME